MSNTKPKLPKFTSEATEAEWSYKNRHTHADELQAGVRSGAAQILTRVKLLERIASSRKPPARVVALRISQADLALARKQAEEKGLPYQTYIKSVLHETLVAREKKQKKAG